MVKFRAATERYWQERERLSAGCGPQELWSVVDQWPLYCGVDNLARFLAIADLFRQTLRVPGHVAEFGSWKGASLLFLAKLLRIYDPNSAKVVHCFESFEGLTQLAVQDGDGEQLSGRYQGSRQELEAMIELYEMADEIVIHQGLIEQTLPQVLEQHAALTFSFVFCDVDLYSPTKALLAHVHPRLAKGGLIVFDEWNHEEFPGEGVAVNEFLRDFGAAYEIEHVMHTRRPTLAIRKLSG